MLRANALAFHACNQALKVDPDNIDRKKEFNRLLMNHSQSDILEGITSLPADAEKSLLSDILNPKSLLGKKFTETNEGMINYVQCRYEFLMLPSMPSRNYLDIGQKYYQAKQYDVAIMYFTKAIDCKPKSVAAYKHRLDAYKKSSDWGNVIADYTRLIQLDPAGSVNYYSQRCYAYSVIKRYSSALDDASQAIQLARASKASNAAIAPILHARGQILHLQNKFDLAIADYNEALTLFPNQAHYRTDRAIAYAAQGKFAEAWPDFHAARKLDPTSQRCCKEWRYVTDYLLKKSFSEWVIYARQFFENIKELSQVEEIKVLDNVDYEHSSIAKAFRELKDHDVVADLLVQALSRRAALKLKQENFKKSNAPKTIEKDDSLVRVTVPANALFSQRKWDVDHNRTLTVSGTVERGDDIAFLPGSYTCRTWNVSAMNNPRFSLSLEAGEMFQYIGSSMTKKT